MAWGVEAGSVVCCRGIEGRECGDPAGYFPVIKPVWNIFVDEVGVGHGMAGAAIAMPLAECRGVVAEVFCDVIQAEETGVLQGEVGRVRCFGRILRSGVFGCVVWGVLGWVWGGAGGECCLGEGLDDLLGEGEDFVDPGLDDIAVP